VPAAQHRSSGTSFPAGSAEITTDDRRRQILTLTDHGRELLAATEKRARRLDREFTGSLTAAQRTALQPALAVLAADAGLPGEGDVHSPG
jgi:hypothetical protein